MHVELHPKISYWRNCVRTHNSIGRKSFRKETQSIFNFWLWKKMLKTLMMSVVKLWTYKAVSGPFPILSPSQNWREQINFEAQYQFHLLGGYFGFETRRDRGQCLRRWWRRIQWFGQRYRLSGGMWDGLQKKVHVLCGTYLWCIRYNTHILVA